MGKHAKSTLATTPGHVAGRLIDWLLSHTLQFVWIALAVYGLYSVNALVNYVEMIGERFYSFTSFVRSEMEKSHELPNSGPIDPGTQD